MGNIDIYNKLRTPPEDVLKKIGAGKLKGYSDINPQWRIEVLTEVFGPCGFGWYTEIVEHWIERETITDAKTGMTTNESTAWVRLNLYVKQGGEWSRPIQGIGGSKQVGKGQGSEMNDEAFKMAETDAISVAAKKLGVAADIYRGIMDTKYSNGEQINPMQSMMGKPTNQSEDVYARIKKAKTRQEIDAIWNSNPQLQKDPKFIAEINHKASKVQ